MIDSFFETKEYLAYKQIYRRISGECECRSASKLHAATDVEMVFKCDNCGRKEEKKLTEKNVEAYYNRALAAAKKCVDNFSGIGFNLSDGRFDWMRKIVPIEPWGEFVKSNTYAILSAFNGEMISYQQPVYNNRMRP